MWRSKSQPLLRAARLLDEAIELVINLKATYGSTRHRAAVLATLDANLRELRYVLHEELARDPPDDDRVWRIISAILGAIVVRVLEALAEIASYKLSQALQHQGGVLLFRRAQGSCT